MAILMSVEEKIRGPFGHKTSNGNGEKKERNENERNYLNFRALFKKLLKHIHSKHTLTHTQAIQIIFKVFNSIVTKLLIKNEL